MGHLDGRIAIVTGAGRGLGREHALLMAAEGAAVVVNDFGTELDGSGSDPAVAQAVVDEIRAAGGTAIADTADVATWDGAEALVRKAVDELGGLDVLVAIAGNVRDRIMVTMSEQDWDDVTRTHLKGTFAPIRHAAAYWRERTKAGEPVDASIITTSSTSGLLGQAGQSNYGAAKAGIAAFTSIIAQEVPRVGARANCVVPAARTRMTLGTPSLADTVAEPSDPSQFDGWHPACVSPLVVLLAKAGGTINGETFFARGGIVQRFENWKRTTKLERDERWTVDELEREISALLTPER
jgi:NAD(P)-dependent dehydrogenase (short-subunit alcohol dehydrogenase family)